MSEAIDLFASKQVARRTARRLADEKGVPHGTGDAVCYACAHEWVAVAPVGTMELECPACHTFRGRFKFDFTPPDGEIYTCNCDNQLFNMTREGMFCPQCGAYHKFP